MGWAIALVCGLPASFAGIDTSEVETKRVERGKGDRAGTLGLFLLRRVATMCWVISRWGATWPWSFGSWACTPIDWPTVSMAWDALAGCPSWLGGYRDGALTVAPPPPETVWYHSGRKIRVAGLPTRKPCRSEHSHVQGGWASPKKGKNSLSGYASNEDCAASRANACVCSLLGRCFGYFLWCLCNLAIPTRDVGGIVLAAMHLSLAALLTLFYLRFYRRDPLFANICGAHARRLGAPTSCVAASWGRFKVEAGCRGPARRSRSVLADGPGEPEPLRDTNHHPKKNGETAAHVRSRQARRVDQSRELKLIAKAYRPRYSGTCR